MISEILETVMIVSFGASWPFNVIRSYKARTAKGKSLSFLCLILFGYAAGIVGKLLRPDFMDWIADSWYVLFFYVLNFIMVATDLMLYFRNKALDKKAENNK